MRSAKHDIYGLAILRLRADLAFHAVLENTDFIQPSTKSTALQYSDCRLVIGVILQGGVYSAVRTTLSLVLRKRFVCAKPCTDALYRAERRIPLKT